MGLKIYLSLVHISEREWICKMLYVMQLRHITAGNIIQAVCISWHGEFFFLHRRVHRGESILLMWRKIMHCVPSNESGKGINLEYIENIPNH